MNLATLAQFGVPSAAYVVFAGALLVMVLFAGLVLAGLRNVRASVADEIKREIASSSQPSQIAVQQPLHVKEADAWVSQQEHEKLAERLDAELGRERGARKEIHREISVLQGDVKVLHRDTETLTRQITLMDQKMDQVLLRLPRKDS